MRQHNKLIVGLTGGFGSGKSTVRHLLEELGAFVIDADLLAHEALLEGNPVYEKIAALFPDARKSGGMDRKKIGGIIFKDKDKRKKLEEIVHPYVFERIGEEIRDAEEKTIVIEVPLLFESGLDRICGKTILVRAPQEEIVKRLIEKGCPEEEIRVRQNAQMPDAGKTKRADFILDNSGSLEKTRREVEKLWRDLHTVFLKKGER